MLSNFEIIKSEFITYEYPIEEKYIHWSRVYEWKYVIDQLSRFKFKKIHNTSCGGLNYGDCLHLTFCDDLEKYCENTIHSDLWGGNYPGTQVKPNKENFIFYDITKKHNEKFDLVLNISTIEHLDSDKRISAIENLIEQVNIGGHLILTFDYPDVDLNQIENFFNFKVNKQENLVTNNRLSVFLIHLKKI